MNCHDGDRALDEAVVPPIPLFRVPQDVGYEPVHFLCARIRHESAIYVRISPDQQRKFLFEILPVQQNHSLRGRAENVPSFEPQSEGRP